MADIQTLSPKQLLFCRGCAILGNPREAALLAGYAPHHLARTVDRLLRRTDVRDEIERLRALTASQTRELALAGLIRLALGGCGDAVSLLSREEPPSREELESLDLFALSEVKSKGGGLELKFHDRLKALELLLHCKEDGEKDDSGSFRDMFSRGVEALNANADGSDPP